MLKAQVPVMLNKQDETLFKLLNSLKVNNVQLMQLDEVPSNKI